MLIASNLGQMLGRLQYGQDVAEQPSGGGVRRDRRAQVLELVRQRGSVAVADLVAALGITRGNASVMLYNMRDDGQLVRTGERGSFRYSLPEAG